MKAGTIIMLVIIFALLCFTCFLVAKSVQLANSKAAKSTGESADPDNREPKT